MSATTDRPRVSLRQFWADLPTPGRWLLSTVAVQTLGRGLTLPFTVIYINEVRGVGHAPGHVQGDDRESVPSDFLHRSADFASHQRSREHQQPDAR